MRLEIQVIGSICLVPARKALGLIHSPKSGWEGYGPKGRGRRFSHQAGPRLTTVVGFHPFIPPCTSSPFWVYLRLLHGTLRGWGLIAGLVEKHLCSVIERLGGQAENPWARLGPRASSPGFLDCGAGSNRK